ncbi:hypothetical protein HY490_02820 [Candidatus Woesearchaeota archaeon]|nr:hypothetical protein [Candidatus Woesearchaeota archaeon]
MDVALSPSLARICGDITGDGHLQLKDWRGLTSFYSKNLTDIRAMNDRFRSVFSISGRVYEDRRYGRLRYKIFFISKPTAEFLASLCVPVGNKTNQPFDVPAWILQGGNDFYRQYLRGLFSSEGSVYSTRTNSSVLRWRIEIEMYKWTKYQKEAVTYMNQIKGMLQKLHILCSPARLGRKNKRKDGTYSIAVKLDIEQHSFKKFYDEVGFDSERKMNILKCHL